MRCIFKVGIYCLLLQRMLWQCKMKSEKADKFFNFLFFVFEGVWGWVCVTVSPTSSMLEQILFSHSYVWCVASERKVRENGCFCWKCTDLWYTDLRQSVMPYRLFIKQLIWSMSYVFLLFNIAIQGAREGERSERQQQKRQQQQQQWYTTTS